jgi:ribosome-binding protein aMBF1 (putative translation factor)|tara:strand:+ start:674 stop:1012 length:339 start_codon:yes stop_codon:yes gene_type:complete
MEHQDWNSITFNTVSQTKNKEAAKKIHSNKTSNPETIKIEPDKNLGKLIAQARNAKNLNQKNFAQQMVISTQLLTRWETGKTIPNNAEIAKIEKLTGVKLPRNKKTKITPED